MKGFKPRPVATGDGPKPPAAARVYAQLRRKIIYGALPAGTVLSEVDTAQELGVSRTPVREAMRSLLNDGLVHEGARRQCVVNGPSAQVEREVAMMRGALETLAIRQVAALPDPGRLDLLRLTMIRMSRAIDANDVNAALDCDDEFHGHICDIAGLPLVADTVRRLHGLARLAGAPGRWTSAVLTTAATEHDQIIDALDRHDADHAERLLHRHLAVPGTPGPRHGGRLGEAWHAAPV
jgi:DNA-binding GntR family transcriptional regulator